MTVLQTPSWHQRPEIMLTLMAIAVPLGLSTYMAVINNFAVERAAFTGTEKGLQESIREIPGFLSFAVVYLLFFIREQKLALIALMLLGVGTAVTGLFPNLTGILVTTFIMSVGFHYFETVNQSLQLQWIKKEIAPIVLGRILAASAVGSLAVYAGVLVLVPLLEASYIAIYLVAGGGTIAITLFCWLAFPMFSQPVVQNKGLVLRRRYWLYYTLTFMGGARRQIFFVFAAFMMVDKFGLELHKVAGVMLANQLLTMWIAPKIGKFIQDWGERRALILEYAGLMTIFTAYAFVDTVWLAIVLYILDHMFFSLAIAMKTYLQKIGDPADMAPTSGVSFTINHIAAVIIPVALGPVYVWNMAVVFLIGTAMAAASLALSLLVPDTPEPGRETILGPRAIATPAE